MITRRTLLKVTLGSLALAARPVRAEAFLAEDGFNVIKLVKAKAPLMSADTAWQEIWGYEGLVPGPTLKAKQGEPFKVRIVNDIGQPTTVHWYGVRGPNAMDGTVLTQQPIPQGGSFDYVFTPPDAGTFLYRPGVNVGEQMDRGLVGALIVEEQGGDDFDDVVMVVDDWSIDGNGQIDASAFGDLQVAASSGRLGNWITVNGTTRPRLTADAASRVRVRLVNAANARTFPILVKGADPWVVAQDGQPVKARHVGEEALQLLPGGRIDLVFPQGQEDVTFATQIRDDVQEIAYLRRDGEPWADDGHDPVLKPNPLPADLPLEGALEVKITIEGGAGGGLQSAKIGTEDVPIRTLVEKRLVWAVAGYAGLQAEPLFKAPKDAVVSLVFDNRTDWPQVLHVHGHSVRIVARNGATVDEPGFRDTILVDPKATLTVAFRADNPGKWLIESSIPERAETGLVTWFEVA